MATLQGRLEDNTYGDLLHIENTNNGFDTILRVVESGNGNPSVLSLSTLAARIAGNLTVTGTTSFSSAPTINGQTVYFPGNQGVAAGLDAGTLDGNSASAFARANQPLTVTGLWTFQNSLSFNLNADVSIFNMQQADGINGMLTLFSSSMFQMRPVVSNVGQPAREFFYDFTNTRWAFDDRPFVGSNGVLLDGDTLDADTLNGQLPSFYQVADNLTGTVPDSTLPTTQAGKTFSSNVVLAQGVDIQARDTLNTARTLLGIAGGTVTQLGSADIPTTIRGSGSLNLDSGNHSYVFNGGTGLETTVDIENNTGTNVGRISTLGNILRLDSIAAAGARALELRVGAAADLALSADHNGGVQIYHNNSSVFETAAANTAASAVAVADNLGNLRDVGFSSIAVLSVSSNTLFARSWTQRRIIKGTTNSITLTLTSTVSDDFQVGEEVYFINTAPAGNLIISLPAPLTLVFVGDAAPASSNSRTIDVGGVMTLWKRSSDTWYCWGMRIS